MFYRAEPLDLQDKEIHERRSHRAIGEGPNEDGHEESWYVAHSVG